MSKVFQELDAGQNGVIWREDFRNILPKFSSKLQKYSADYFDAVFDLLDLDGDGYIQVNEFTPGISNQLLTPENLKQAFLTLGAIES